MSISLTTSTKNTVTLANDAKGPDTTWDQATYTWNDASGTWDVPGTVLSTDAKNTMSLSNDAKN